jgi:hypothetical protein
MLTRSRRAINHPIDRSEPAPQYLTSTAPPGMGEYPFEGRSRTRAQTSSVTPTGPARQSIQYHASSLLNQTARLSQPGMPHPQVPNTPGFHPPSQWSQSFPTQSHHPPIGTGRPFLYNNRTPAKDVVSVTSRQLHPSGTYQNPFADSLKPYIKPDQQRGQANSTDNSRPYVPPQRRNPVARLDSRAITREPAQHGVSVRTESPTRRGSVSIRRASQGEPQDRRNKPGDNSPPRGVFKRRRSSLPRKAAIAARAAIANSARNEAITESEEVKNEAPDHSWAQVASGRVKEESTEDNVPLHDVPQLASVQIKEEKVEEGPRTWAKIAAAEWMDSKSKEQETRNNSFGKPLSNLWNMSLRSRDYVQIEVKEEPREDTSKYSLAAPAKQILQPFKRSL